MNVAAMLNRKGNEIYSLGLDQTVREAIAIFAERNIGVVLAIDSDGALAGIVSERDLVRCLHQVGSSTLEQPISDLMTRSVITCTPETTIADALSLMGTHRIRHLPVVRGAEILGLISIRDVLESQLESHEQHFAALIRAKQEAALARQAAELSNRAKSEFLANISYELTAPLGTIVGVAEYLGNEADNLPRVPDCARYLREIEDSGRHVLKTFEDLLDLSRLQIGALEPADEIVAIPEIVEDCLAIVTKEAERKGIALDFGVETALPELVADRKLVHRLLYNLLDNAIKFTPVGGTVSVRCTLGNEGDMRVTIDDTGIGIPPENLAKITQPFQRLETVTGAGRKSTSLSLALVDAIAQAHDGVLDLKSRVGIGTTATLRFPAARTVAFAREDLAELGQRAGAA
jgi:signal transduction histidine kinase